MPAHPAPTPALPNGSGAAAVLAASIGSFALAILAVLGDKLAPLRQSLNFYRPTGPLSGVTTLAILCWLVTWLVLELRWRRRNISMTTVNAVAFTLLALSLLLTFPPIADAL